MSITLSRSPSLPLPQCVLLGIRTMHVLTRYTIFLYDMRHGGLNNESISWDKRGSASYYIELVFEMAALLIDLLHHLHMVSCCTWIASPERTLS